MLYMKEMRAKVIAECTLKESAAINQILGRRVRAGQAQRCAPVARAGVPWGGSRGAEQHCGAQQGSDGTCAMVGGVRTPPETRAGERGGGGGSPVTVMEIGVLVVVEALPPRSAGSILRLEAGCRETQNWEKREILHPSSNAEMARSPARPATSAASLSPAAAPWHLPSDALPSSPRARFELVAAGQGRGDPAQLRACPCSGTRCPGRSRPSTTSWRARNGSSTCSSTLAGPHGTTT